MHENLLRVFFNNVVLEDADEDDEELCWTVAINTFVMGVLIRVTQAMVAKIFGMLESGPDSEHEGYLSSMIMPNDNAPYLLFHERLLHLFISYIF